MAMKTFSLGCHVVPCSKSTASKSLLTYHAELFQTWSLQGLLATTEFTQGPPYEDGRRQGAKMRSL
jgi:hypothetical protein